MRVAGKSRRGAFRTRDKTCGQEDSACHMQRRFRRAQTHTPGRTCCPPGSRWRIPGIESWTARVPRLPDPGREEGFRHQAPARLRVAVVWHAHAGLEACVIVGIIVEVSARPRPRLRAISLTGAWRLVPGAFLRPPARAMRSPRRARTAAARRGGCSRSVRGLGTRGRRLR